MWCPYSWATMYWVGQVAGRAELRLQLLQEVEVEVRLAVARAVERPGLRVADTAPGLGLTRVQHRGASVYRWPFAWNCVRQNVCTSSTAPHTICSMSESHDVLAPLGPPTCADGTSTAELPPSPLPPSNLGRRNAARAAISTTMPPPAFIGSPSPPPPPPPPNMPPRPPRPPPPPCPRRSSMFELLVERILVTFVLQAPRQLSPSHSTRGRELPSEGVGARRARTMMGSWESTSRSGPTKVRCCSTCTTTHWDRSSATSCRAAVGTAVAEELTSETFLAAVSAVQRGAVERMSVAWLSASPATSWSTTGAAEPARTGS